VLSLDGGDLGHSSEDVSTVSCCSLHAVAVIDLPFTCFLVHVELGMMEGSQIRRTGENTRGLDSRVLRKDRAGSWTPGSVGGGLGSGPLGLWEEDWGLDPWV
jgi:hypothetical protein